MFKRAIFSKAFVIGGIITLFVLLLLHSFGQAEAGISASSVSPESPSDSVIISMLCGYFFISAFGLVVSKAKSALWFWAVLAHALLVIVYVVIFASTKTNDSDGYKWPTEVFQLAMVMAVYFLPWLILWAVVLLSKNVRK
jgi:hypothetical protein